MMTKCLGWLNRWATSFRWISPSFSPSLGNALYKTLCGLDKSFYHLLVERATSKLIKRHVMGITDILHCQVAHSIFHTMNVPLAMVRKTGRPYSKVLLSSFPTIIYHCLQSYIIAYNHIWAEHWFWFVDLISVPTIIYELNIVFWFADLNLALGAHFRGVFRVLILGELYILGSDNCM